jgi:chemosensory pili system protein ChpA (sensor histidine kinase/response regulator)
LGDYGFDVEKVCNRLVEEDRAVTPSVLTMIDVAQRNFRHWVDALTQTGQVLADPRELHAAIAAVEAEIQGAVAELPTDTELPADAEPPTDAPPVPSNVYELPKPHAVVPPPLDLIELPELGAGDAHRAPLVATDDALMETIEVKDVPLAESRYDVLPELELPAFPTATVLKLVTDAPPVESTPPEPLPPAEPEEITIGGVRVSTALWKILCDEARQHLGTLENELSVLQFDPRTVPSPEMIRAGHTLCGIHRTGGFPMVAATARSLEQTLLALAERGAPLPSNAHPVLARAIAGLNQFVHRVEAREEFSVGDQTEAALIQAELEELRQETASQAQDAETAAAAAALHDEESRPLASADATPVDTRPPLHTDAQLEAPQDHSLLPGSSSDEILLPLAQEDPLATIRDDVDEQVLPIFLDEAAELFPQAGEELRAWRRNPQDAKPVSELRRTLHTLKGSARMAGAMRLGELTHLMESYLGQGDVPSCDARVLRDAGNVSRPHRVRARPPARWRDQHPVALGGGSARRCAGGNGRGGSGRRRARGLRWWTNRWSSRSRLPTAAPSVIPLAPAAAAPSVVTAQTETVPELETGTRAQLRVRADVIDRLVNEAGEVAIARARVEGELRSLKANLLELTNSVIRLRAQMREIEIQAESQIQSQMSLMQEQPSDFDPLEFDRYTRFQELTRSLAEGINDVSTVQHSLLKNLDDADAALLAQARLSREVQQRLFSIRTVPLAACPSACTGSCGPPPRNWTSAPTSRSTAPRSNSTVRCWKNSLVRWSTCCAMRWTTASKRVTRASSRETRDRRNFADRAPGRQRSRDRSCRRRRRSRLLASARARPVARAVRGRRGAHRRATRRIPVRARLLHGVEGHPDFRAGHRHGRSPRRSRHARRAASKWPPRLARARASC